MEVIKKIVWFFDFIISDLTCHMVTLKGDIRVSKAILK